MENLVNIILLLLDILIFIAHLSAAIILTVKIVQSSKLLLGLSLISFSLAHLLIFPWLIVFQEPQLSWRIYDLFPWFSVFCFLLIGGALFHPRDLSFSGKRQLMPFSFSVKGELVPIYFICWFCTYWIYNFAIWVTMLFGRVA